MPSPRIPSRPSLTLSAMVPETSASAIEIHAAEGSAVRHGAPPLTTFSFSSVSASEYAMRASMSSSDR